MRRIFMTTAAGAALLGAAAIAASSALATEQAYDVGGFDRISSVGPNTIVVRVGSAASVRAEGPQETLDLMKVVVEDGELRIQPKREHWDHNEWNKWEEIEPATYYVTVPSLTSAAAVGSGKMTIDRVDGSRFGGTVAGSATLDIASLSVEDARFSVAGSGDIVARGSANRSKVSIAGSGTMHGRAVASQAADVSIAGSGDVELSVKDDVHISMVGSGNVDVTGGARCTVSAFGSGKARCNGALVENKDRDRWARWDRRDSRWTRDEEWDWDWDWDWYDRAERGDRDDD